MATRDWIRLVVVRKLLKEFQGGFYYELQSEASMVLLALFHGSDTVVSPFYFSLQFGFFFW